MNSSDADTIHDAKHSNLFKNSKNKEKQSYRSLKEKPYDSAKETVTSDNLMEIKKTNGSLAIYHNNSIQRNETKPIFKPSHFKTLSSNSRSSFKSHFSPQTSVRIREIDEIDEF